VGPPVKAFGTILSNYGEVFLGGTTKVDCWDIWDRFSFGIQQQMQGDSSTTKLTDTEKR
jgi:hypothetical protein